jgi:hypothetical protein
MNPQHVLPVALLTGLQFAFSMGAFLPVSTLLVTEQKDVAWVNAKRWIAGFSVSSCLSAFIFALINNNFIEGTNLLFNITFIVFGILMIAALISRSSKLNSLVVHRYAVFAIGVVEGTISGQVLELFRSMDITPSVFNMELLVMMFTLVVIVVVILLCLVFRFLVSISTTGRLSRYLVGLFSSLCILMSILNLISSYG